MIKASKILLLGVLIATTLISPSAAKAMPSPSATWCEKTGGEMQIITNPDGSQAGKCVYWARYECSDYEFYKGNGCIPQRLLFGSINWIPSRIILIILFVIIIYRILRSIKKTILKSNQVK